MKYKLTKAEQETVINFDNELNTASVYTHDSRLIKKLRELRKQYPEQFIFGAPGAWVGHLYDSETLCWYPTAVQ